MVCPYFISLSSLVVVFFETFVSLVSFNRWVLFASGFHRFLMANSACADRDPTWENGGGGGANNCGSKGNYEEMTSMSNEGILLHTGRPSGHSRRRQRLTVLKHQSLPLSYPLSLLEHYICAYRSPLSLSLARRAAGELLHRETGKIKFS